MADSYLSASALRAYGQVAGLKPEAGVATTGSESGVLPDFSALVRSAASQVSEAGQTLETSVVQAAAGEADLIDVVTAVAAAEASLETVIAVRDQVIKAYQEIIRMPI